MELKTTHARAVALASEAEAQLAEALTHAASLEELSPTDERRYPDLEALAERQRADGLRAKLNRALEARRGVEWQLVKLGHALAEEEPQPEEAEAEDPAPEPQRPPLCIVPECGEARDASTYCAAHAEAERAFTGAAHAA